MFLSPLRPHAPTLASAALALALTFAAADTFAATPADQLAAYQAAAGAKADAARGQAFFTRTHGREWSCSSCHGATPTGTGKPIQPLAPAFNPERFSDPAKVEKWFRRNCNDVLARECSAGEKADVLAWLMTLK